MITISLRNNEIVFKGMKNVMEFTNALGAVKTIKPRENNGTVYVPLEQVDGLGLALQDYKGKFEAEKSYQNVLRFLKPAPVKIKWTPSYCYIEGGRLPFKDIIPNTSYFDKKFLQMEIYKRGNHSGMVHLFNVAKGRFPSGLLERVIKPLEDAGIPYEIDRTFDYPEPYLDLNPNLPFEPTEDQVRAVEALAKANNGIGKLPTGFGKTSYVSVALIAKKGVRTMFLANQRILINDAKDDFESAFRDDGIEVGVIGDGEYNPQDITVASIQGVVAALEPPTIREIEQAEKEIRLAELKYNNDPTPVRKGLVTKAKNKLKSMRERHAKRQSIVDYLKTVDMFIIDEGQVIGTAMWNKFFEHCPAPYRYTLTATDTRTDGGRIQIIAATGERRFESSASEQIKKGRLADFKAYFKRFDHGIEPEVLKSMTLSYHLAYDAFIVNNDKRNNYLCDWVQKWKQEGNSVIALVTRREHGFIVQDVLTERGMREGVDFAYVDGQTPKTERRAIIEDFREGRVPILIGTSIFDVGFNAKIASKMVRFNAGSSEVRETQRAGRTVRVREDGSRGETIDLIDENVPYFQSQGWKRYRLIGEEFGAERTQIIDGVIKGETTVAKLKDVANEIDEATDKHTLLHAIDNFVNRKKHVNESLTQFDDDVSERIDDIFNMPGLKDIAEEIAGRVSDDFD